MSLIDSAASVSLRNLLRKIHVTFSSNIVNSTATIILLLKYLLILEQDTQHIKWVMIIMINKFKWETLKIKTTKEITTKSHSHHIIQKIIGIKFKIKRIVFSFFILVFFSLS